MAKKKTDPAEQDDVIPVGDEISASSEGEPADGEPSLEQLRAENARLKAELARREPTPDVAPAAAAGQPQRFRVSLEGAPTWVVEALDAANAWAAYRAATGVISSMHTPEISPAGESPLGRVGF